MLLSYTYRPNKTAADSGPGSNRSADPSTSSHDCSHSNYGCRVCTEEEET